MSSVAPLRAELLAAEAELGSRAAAWDAALAAVAHAHGLGGDRAPGTGFDAWRDRGAAAYLGAVHESLLDDDRRGRQSSGAFYTPAPIVDWLLDRALPTGDLARVLDPACGAGNVLVAVVRRLGPSAVSHVHGLDLDPVAVAITRLSLRIAAPDVDPALLERTIRVGDGLAPHPDAPTGGYDVVVGNPPFGGRLRRVADPGRRGPAAYTDTSAVFLDHAVRLVRPGGAVALVQPLSLLAARDATPVRAAVVAAGAVSDLWASATPVFPGTPVLTCVPVVRVGEPQAAVATWQGAVPVRGDDLPLPDAEWGPLAAAAFGIPSVTLSPAHGVLGDLARCTADFRDQYYGLAPHVRESSGDPHEARLVTSGLVDPAECRWGTTPTRFAKTSYAAPVVDLASLRADGALTAWAEARLVPKVLVATQGRVLEAVVDERGTWLPSVPVVTVTLRPDPLPDRLPDRSPDRLWHVLAVLLAPPVVAAAAARYAGTALSGGAIKLSATAVGLLPLPPDGAAWDAGADLARSAQHAAADDRPALLADCARAMSTAYGLDPDGPVTTWWLARLRAVRT